MTTFNSLYFHLVWSTKNREPYTSEIIERPLYQYITGILRNKGADALQIGGMPDHIHLLLKTTPMTVLSDLVKDVKVNSTRWVRSMYPGLPTFSWQEGFGAFSVSKSNTDAVRDYILNQKNHHIHVPFDKEWVQLLMKHEISYDPKYVLG